MAIETMMNTAQSFSSGTPSRFTALAFTTAATSRRSTRFASRRVDEPGRDEDHARERDDD